LSLVDKQDQKPDADGHRNQRHRRVRDSGHGLRLSARARDRGSSPAAIRRTFLFVPERNPIVRVSEAKLYGL
jgi:hypothetical protein